MKEKRNPVKNSRFRLSQHIAKGVAFKALVMLLFISIDLFSKAYFLMKFPRLVVENSGIAFGLLSGNNYVSAIVVVGIVLSFVYLLSHFEAKGIFGSWGVVLLFSGAFANLLNRTFYGAYIVDFIRISSFPSFNIADLYIVLGLGLILFKIYPCNK